MAIKLIGVNNFFETIGIYSLDGIMVDRYTIHFLFFYGGAILLTIYLLTSRSETKKSELLVKPESN